MSAPRITRRVFLGGLAIGVLATRLGRSAHAALAGGFRANVFVRLMADGSVEIVCHRTEMGQGVRSSLPRLIADELGADVTRVRVVQGDGDKRYGDQNTDGSSSVRSGLDALRMAGATARALLVAAAAKRLGVRESECTTKDGAVVCKGKDPVPFAVLLDDAAKLPVPKNVTLRPRAELTHLGQPAPLVDGQDIVTGRAVFGADVRLPGMLTAVILRPPTVWGRVRRYDPSAALAVPGVRQVLELPAPAGAAVKFQPLGGLAVLADHTWAALCGRDALEVTWELGENATYDSIAFKEALLATVRVPQKSVRSTGDVERALADAAKVISAEYYVPHLAHAAMEPPAALAHVREGSCEAWTSTQDPQTAQAEVASALGFDESRVTVHVTLTGGGFGRKSKPDYVVEAALLSRAAGAPVRVQWTRQDDIQNSYYHTVSAQRLEGAIDAGGRVTAWRQRIAFPTISSTFVRTRDAPSSGELAQGPTDMPLAVPNVRIEAGAAKAHLRIGWYRSVCNIFHAFSSGSFIDELAHARSRDPLDAWLELIGPPRLLTPKEAGVGDFKNYGAPTSTHPIDVGRYRHVIQRVTDMAGWRTRAAQQQASGRALGLSAHRSFLSAVAVVVAVVLRDGRPAVDEAWVVIDAGTILNSDRVRAQMEGAVIFGMSLAFYGRITAAHGAVQQTNFRDYPIVRMHEAPRRIHVDIVPSDALPGGVGEPGVPPVAPAIANAIFALTGERLRALPFFS